MSDQRKRLIMVVGLAVAVCLGLVAALAFPASTESAASPFRPPEGARAAAPDLMLAYTGLSTEIPTPAPTPTPVPYYIGPVEPPGALGIDRLFIAEIDLNAAEPVARQDLRLLSEDLYPQTGRYGDLRGPYRLVHLGSDYFSLGRSTLRTPTPYALLAVAAYVYRDSYTGIAIDMSGNLQMYLVMLDTEAGPQPYLINFCHFSPGSNEYAIAQATSSGGLVENMGEISIVGSDDQRMSDVHISVIDVEALLAFTGAESLRAALVELFSDRLPRTNQQYPTIFVEPESLYPALQARLAAWTAPEQ